MSSKSTENMNKFEEPAELDPLMEAFNPGPVQADQPARFYWQEPWHEASADACVQAAFEN